MPELSYREAVRDALAHAMRNDDDVFIMAAHPTLSEAIKEAGLVALGRPIHIATRRSAPAQA